MAKKKTPVEEVIEEEVGTNDGETIPAKTLEEKMDIIDKAFEEIESKFLSGSTEQMNAQQNDFLSLKIKIKRLF